MNSISLFIAVAKTYLLSGWMRRAQYWPYINVQFVLYGNKLCYKLQNERKSKNIWDKLFKNEPSKNCGRQPLKNFTWSILEHFVPFVLFRLVPGVN